MGGGGHVAGWDMLDYVHCFSLQDWQAPEKGGRGRGDGGGLKVAGRRH